MFVMNLTLKFACAINANILFLFLFFCFPLPFAGCACVQKCSTRTHKMGEGCRQSEEWGRGRQVCLGGVALVFVALPLKCASVALSC